MPFPQFDKSIGVLICTTNAIENLNARLRWAVNARAVSLAQVRRDFPRWSSPWPSSIVSTGLPTFSVTTASIVLWSYIGEFTDRRKPSTSST